MALISNSRLLVFVLMIGSRAVSAAAQELPEMDGVAMLDTGPAPVAGSCDCVTSPFTMPVERPDPGPASRPSSAGWGTAAKRRRLRELAVNDRLELPRLMKEALGGNEGASARLGVLFTADTVVPRDNVKAAYWFRLAASQGNADAPLQLAYRYIHGYGVRRNDAAAAYWYGRSALLGNNKAMLALGLLYAAGRGVAQDWASAIAWWTAARDHTALASRFLGDAYMCGVGVQKDAEHALAEYVRAADAGEVSSMVQLGHMYRSGCARADDETVFARYKKAADASDPEAQIALSELYFEGLGTPPSAYSAYMWARLAELRLPDGGLRTSANLRVRQAAGLMSTADVGDAEMLVRTIISLPSR